MIKKILMSRRRDRILDGILNHVSGEARGDPLAEARRSASPSFRTIRNLTDDGSGPGHNYRLLAESIFFVCPFVRMITTGFGCEPAITHQ